jgi:hypothetical protein
MIFFCDEIQKLAAMPAPAPPPQQEKKKNIVTRNIGLGTLGLGALGTFAALKNPAAASKYLGQVKQMVTNPKAALQRGFRSGATGIKSGPGASEAASKRVSLYKDTLRSALGSEGQKGRLLQFKSLDDINAGTQSARTSGWLGVGARRSGKESLELNKGLRKKVEKALGQLDAGKRVDEAQLSKLYQDIGQAGRGLDTKRGLTSFLPGERSVMLGLGGAGGAAAGLESEDPETGRKRGVGERIARGAVGATIGTMATPLFMGRGAGLSKANLFTGSTKPSLLSQKTLLPLAASGVISGAATGVTSDLAGGGGRLADRAFGQES